MGYDKGDFQAIRLTFFISPHIMRMTPHTTPQSKLYAHYDTQA